MASMNINLESVSLTLFYFFGAVPVDWMEYLIAQLALEPQPEVTNVWRNARHSQFLNMEQTDEQDITLVRLMLTLAAPDSLKCWRQLSHEIFLQHERLWRQAPELNFLGCSLVYHGIHQEPAPVRAEEWLKDVPVREALSWPQVAHLRCGELWQVQAVAEQQMSEIIYGLLVTQEQAEVVRHQLLYHPAFWQAEAIRHQTNHAWKSWQANETTRRETNHRLRELFRLLLSARPDTSLRELGILYAVFQSHVTKLHDLHQQIIDASQIYQELSTVLWLPSTTNDVRDEVLVWFAQLRQQLLIEERIISVMDEQIGNSLQYQQTVLAIRRQQYFSNFLGWLTWVFGFGILTWGIRQYHKLLALSK